MLGLFFLRHMLILSFVAYEVSMWSFWELQRWLDEYYPDLRVRELREGAWCIEQMVGMPVYVELDPSWAYDGIAWMQPASTLVFDVRNRLPGGWVCDEIIKRDPRLASNEGNHYHEAWKLSKAAEAEHEKRNKDAQKSALDSWEIARRNPALMERVSRHLEVGDTAAAVREFAPETMLRNAVKENAAELRRKDFWRAI